MDGYTEYSTAAAAIEAAQAETTKAPWRLSDEGCDTYILADDEADALAAAEEWGEGGTYDERVLVTVHFAPVLPDGEIDRDHSDSVEVEAGEDPEPPPCVTDDDGATQDHNWNDGVAVASDGRTYCTRSHCERAGCDVVRVHAGESYAGQYPRLPEQTWYR
jgi:hypothetical protein